MMRQRPTSRVLLAAAFAAGALLFASAHGAVAHGHHHHHHGGSDNGGGPFGTGPVHGPGSSHNPIVYHPVHGPGSTHNPIIAPVVRDHRGRSHSPTIPAGSVINDHRRPHRVAPHRGCRSGYWQNCAWGSVHDHRG